jgi:cell division protein FtsW
VEPSAEPSDAPRGAEHAPSAGVGASESWGSGTAGHIDPWLLFAVLALCGIGLLMVYSTSAWLGHRERGSWEYYFVRQAAWLAAGLVILAITAAADYRILRRLAVPGMVIAFVFLVAVLFTAEAKGVRRWLRIGPVNLQPSEIAKLALAMFLAATLARQGERVRAFKQGFLPVVAVAGLTMVLVLLERDLGTTILLGGLGFTMLYVAGTRLAYVAGAAMIAAPIAWSQIIGVAYRRVRLEEFFANEGYQVEQSMIAIGSGGPFGLGLGAGRQKLGFLPENHTDFILAGVGEELGFVGISVVIALYGLLLWRGLRAAHHAPDRFGTYLAVGLSALFGLQAIINVAVVLQVVPAKGITLPFLSYGGSSLVASLAAAGVLLSISRRPGAWRWSDQRRAPRHPLRGSRDAAGNRRRTPGALPAGAILPG